MPEVLLDFPRQWVEFIDPADNGTIVRADLTWLTSRWTCIFHNDPDFAGGYGCALHHLAAAEGVSFIETKPDVCWQLPLRRSYETREYEDEVERTVVVLGEYERRNWGPGGHDFPWYCTANTEAHVGTEPVFVSSRDEIVAMIGQPAYDELARLCRARDLLLQGRRFELGLSPHPADPKPPGPAEAAEREQR